MRETGPKKATEPTSRNFEGAQRSADGYGDRVESNKETQAGRQVEAASSAASDGRAETTGPTETEHPAASDGHAETERHAETTRPAETERPAESEGPSEAEPTGEAERSGDSERAVEPQRPTEDEPATEGAQPEETPRPAPTERSYADRIAEGRQVAPTERPVGARRSYADRIAESREAARPERPVEAVPPAERPEGVEMPAVPERAPEPGLTSEVTQYADASNRPVHGSGRGVDTLDQGELNNCYFVASVNAIAHRDPEWIGRMVHETADGDVVVELGERRPMAPTLPSGENAVVPARNEWGDVYGHAPDGSTGGGYLEKWFAQREGGYEQINSGRWPRESLSALTEREAHHQPVASLPDAELLRVLGPDCAAVASTWDLRSDPHLKDLARKNGMARTAAHAYTVEGLDDQDRVVLRNPWGVQHPRPIPLRDFRALFSSVDWCDVPRKESK